MKILCQCLSVIISKRNILLVICIAKNFKGEFLNISIFFAPSDSRFSNSCVSAKYCPIITNIHQWKVYLFSFHMMYKSQNIDPYDWFNGPGSQIFFCVLQKERKQTNTRVSTFSFFSVNYSLNLVGSFSTSYSWSFAVCPSTLKFRGSKTSWCTQRIPFNDWIVQSNWETQQNWDPKIQCPNSACSLQCPIGTVKTPLFGWYHYQRLSSPGPPHQHLGIVGIGPAQCVGWDGLVVAENVRLFLVQPSHQFGTRTKRHGRIHLNVYAHTPAHRLKNDTLFGVCV